MTGPAHIVPIFATPFAAVDTGADPDFNARVAALCEARRAEPARRDLFDQPDATARELEQLVLRHASGIVAKLTRLGATEFGRLRVQAQAWAVVLPRNAHVAAQHFPNASWLAVYCARVGESDAQAPQAGVLRLYERRLASVHRDASIDGLDAPWRYGNHAWSPAAGQLALFPAHLSHEVSVVRSDTALILVFAMLRFLAEPGG